jgi:SAM-dependent methyltransferase
MRKDNLDAVRDQFTKQAVLFSQSPAMGDEAAIKLLIEASGIKGGGRVLDVACGPGLVACAFAESGARTVGIDATPAMIERAKALANEKGLANVEWRVGVAHPLPFDDNSFDVVTCRFAFHHYHDPAKAFAEMKRVCRPDGMIVVCDAYTSDDPAKAEAFNRMERLRDPSTERFLRLNEIEDFFRKAELQPEQHFYRVPLELESLMKGSFPKEGDAEVIRGMIVRSADNGDSLGINVRRGGDQIVFDYPVVILAARKS